MRKLFVVIIILYSGFCFSQTPDRISLRTDTLSKDFSWGISISMLSPGFSFYSSEVKSYMKGNDYWNLLNIGFRIKNISMDFLFNLKGMKLTDSYSIYNRTWSEGMKLVHESIGINVGYKFKLSPRFFLKPNAGFVRSKYYHEENSDYNSRASLSGQFGLTSEFKLKTNIDGPFVSENGNIVWSSNYWSILLQAGVYPSMFKANTGLKGNLYYLAIGGCWSLGHHKHYRN